MSPFFRNRASAVATVILGASLMTGCRTWRGYDPFARPVAVGSPRTCMTIGIQNLDDTQASAVITTAQEVCRIIDSPAFAAEVLSRDWWANCSRGELGTKIPRADVLSLVRSQPSFSVQPRKPFRAVGVGDSSQHRIAVNPIFIRNALQTDLGLAGELRETLAHEMTHVAAGRVQDDGHGGKCLEDSLVSYGIGRLVRRMWVAERRSR